MDLIARRTPDVKQDIVAGCAFNKISKLENDKVRNYIIPDGYNLDPPTDQCASYSGEAAAIYALSTSFLRLTEVARDKHCKAVLYALRDEIFYLSPMKRFTNVQEIRDYGIHSLEIRMQPTGF